MSSIDIDSGDDDEVFGPQPSSPTPRRTNNQPIDQQSPTHSPRRYSRTYGDRYIPSREGINLQAAFGLASEENDTNKDNEQASADTGKLFNALLKAELFGDDVPTAIPRTPRKNRFDPTSSDGSKSPILSKSAPVTPNKNFLRFNSPTRNRLHRGSSSSASSTRTSVSEEMVDSNSDLYSTSPIRMDSQRLLLNRKKKSRVISKVPYKVLDAPELADDFYVDLVDWGSKNILGVGLASSVYLWHAQSGRVQKLCDLANDRITSLSWLNRGTHIAIGTESGTVQIWDAEAQKRVRSMTGHDLRTGCLAWNEHILTSGSRDRTILHRDVRISQHYIKRISEHKQEVCGLKWNTEENQLASGSNDNRVLVFDGLDEKPLHKFDEHIAAVKALSWSPHQRGLLASGGGTADQSIKFWNTLTGSMVNQIKVQSQVCNLLWSKNSNELVSTHGYSHNQVILWKYPGLEQVASLTGHTYRVLFLTLSPDGRTVVTGAGDETLRFWNVFEENKSEKNASGLLDVFQQLR